MADEPEWKTVKIPLAAYKQARALSGQLKQYGVAFLPQELRVPEPPQRCPECDSPVHTLQVSYKQVKCTNKACGYENHVLGMSADTWKGIGIGTVVTLGLLGIGLLVNEAARSQQRSMLRARPPLALAPGAKRSRKQKATKRPSTPLKPRRSR